MTKRGILLAHEQYLFPSVFHYFKEPLVMVRAKDQFVWDADGNQIELVEDRERKAPATAATIALMEAARENRVLIGRGGLDGNVVRITPPLNISKTDVDDFGERLSASLDRVGSAMLAHEYGRKSLL